MFRAEGASTRELRTTSHAKTRGRVRVMGYGLEAFTMEHPLILAWQRFEQTGAGFSYYSYAPGGAFRLHLYKMHRRPKKTRATCGASTRSGGNCLARVCVRADGTLARRCRLHGGLSTGAKTEAGRARIAESNRRRAMQRREAASTHN